VTWTERLLVSLDNATRAHCNGDRQGVIALMSAAFAALDDPICEQDRAFLRAFGPALQRCRALFEKFRAGDRLVVRPMWDNFKTLFCELEERLRKTDTIALPKVSEALAARRAFALTVPGTYAVDGSAPPLATIDPTLVLLATQQRPRAVHMEDAGGRRYKFLLKGNEDLRLDQRIMQFFHLLNALLAGSRLIEMAVLRYAIVPFTPSAGLIAWVTGADTFQQLVNDFRAHRDAPLTIESDVMQGFVGTIFNGLGALQRLEVFDEVAQAAPGDDLREMLWLRSPDPAHWLARNHNFTVSTALMSVAGYVIGLGDRHPSNIMVQRHTGRVIHIDFGDSFEVAMRRTLLPERVPFRMTRMIVNALDGASVDGLFRRCCEDVLWVVRESQSPVIAQLEVFSHEPIFHERETRAHGTPREILQRVAAKLSGNDPRDWEKGETELDAQRQADILIRVAADPYEYARHFSGWCPFW
jgi:phosphatidylinositol kinase/protein kinase (PI-3  family)